MSVGLVVGDALRQTLIHEELGGGIMIAINFNVSFAKQQDPETIEWSSPSTANSWRTKW